jgi:hypothetical protein
MFAKCYYNFAKLDSKLILRSQNLVLNKQNTLGLLLVQIALKQTLKRLR